MKNARNIVLSLTLLVIIAVVSGYTKKTSNPKVEENIPTFENKQDQTVNLFVTHGHCSTPFAGIVDDLKVNAPLRKDLGNPLENMEISFQIDPHSFNVCAGEELTARIKTPGLFIGKHNEKITFHSTNVYTMGIDWYQVNGTLSIKGVEREVKFFVTGVRDPNETMASSLVLEGQMDLYDWGIDYDKIVSGRSSSTPTKWMYINMRIELC